MKLLKIWLLTFSMLGSISVLRAQHVTGRIVNESHSPMPYATVALYDKDTTLVHGTVTDSAGYFTFAYEHLPFFLEAQYLGYAMTKHRFDSLSCGDIVLREKSQELQSAIVTTNKPMVHIEPSGGLVYTAAVIREQYPVSTAYDLIKKLPGVMEQSDGELSLIGTNALKIVINGRPSSMTAAQLLALLQSLPAERVVSLKVLYSPPPKYQTRGAVIDVILSQAIKFQGEVHGEYQTKYVNSWKSGASLTLPWKKVGLDVAYEFLSPGSQTEINFSGIHHLHGTHYDIRQQQSIRTRSYKHQMRAGIDIALSEQSKLNVAYNGLFSPKSKAHTYSAGNFLTSENLKNEEDKAHNFSLQYEHNKGWSAKADYTAYHLDQTENITNQRIGYATNVFNVASSQQVDRWQFAFDKAFALGTSSKLNVGTSYTHSESKDNSFYKILQGTPSVTDTKSQLREQNYTLYAGLEKRFTPQWMATAYLTAEHYQRDNQKRWRLFPQASLTYTASANHILQATFSSEKVYPSFSSMQQVVFHLDGYAEVHGNPNLLPMQHYQGTAMYILKQKYIAQLFYSYDDHYFKQSGYQDPDRLRLIYKTQNWDYGRVLGANIIVPLQYCRPIDHRLILVLANMRLSTNDFYGHHLRRDKCYGIIQLENNIQLASKPNLTLNLSGFYHTPSLQAAYDLDAFWACNATIKYTSPSKALSVTLTGNDLFETGVPKARAKWGIQDFTADTRFKTRSIVLRLSYSFGGYKKKEYKAIDTSRFGF